MKRKIFSILFVLSLSFQTPGFSLKVRQDTFGDIKVFVTQNPSEADLIVFMTDIRIFANNKEDVWFIDKDFPDLKIAMTTIKTAADLIIYLTTFQGQSRWRSEDHPLKGKLYSLSKS